MRNVFPFLVLVGVGILAITVLLPVLGFLLVLVVIVVALALVALVAAPLLAKLPWFRTRMTVRNNGAWRTVRFGNSVYTSYSEGTPDEPSQPPEGQLGTGDIIDVEGKELPERDEAQPPEQ